MTKPLLALVPVLIAATSLLAAPDEDVRAALDRLAAEPNYSWKSSTTTVSPSHTGAAMVIVTGQTETNGPTLAVLYKVLPKQNLTAVFQEQKAAVKLGESWTTAAELQPGGTMAKASSLPFIGSIGRAASIAGTVAGTVSTLLSNEPLLRLHGWQWLRLEHPGPVEMARYLFSNVQAWSTLNGIIEGELSPMGAGGMQLWDSLGREPGFRPGQTPRAKGRVSFWISDGRLEKFEVASEYLPNDFILKVGIGAENPNLPISRTTTVIFSDEGRTKVDVPVEAGLKLGLAGQFATAP